jgi:hypothetical protein
MLSLAQHVARRQCMKCAHSAQNAAQMLILEGGFKAFTRFRLLMRRMIVLLTRSERYLAKYVEPSRARAVINQLPKFGFFL